MLKKIFLYILKIIKFPFWILQIFTGAKSFIDNPFIGNYLLNKYGFHACRVLIAHRLAAWRRKKLVHNIAVEDYAAYERDGFVVKPNFLSPAIFDELLNQIKSYRATVREMRQGDTITRRIALEPRVLDKMPAVKILLDMPEYQAIINYVASTKTESVFYIQTILSHVSNKLSSDPQLCLHSDTFHPTVKAWLFLEDISEDAGPFTYVPGSHRLTPQRLQWEYDMSLNAAKGSLDRLSQRGSFRVIEPDQTLKSLNLPPVKRFAVKANTLIVADTYGFHARGMSAQPTCRVEIWAYDRRNPFLPWAGFDLWKLSGLSKWRALFYWKGLDLIEKAGIKPNIWQKRSDTTAFEVVSNKLKAS